MAEVNKTIHVLNSDELQDLYTDLRVITTNRDYYKLSNLEYSTLMNASRIVHELEMAARFVLTTEKLTTGGVVHK